MPREFTENQIKNKQLSASSAVEHETFATQQKDQVVFAKFDLQASCTFGFKKMKLALFYALSSTKSIQLYQAHSARTF